MVVIAAVSPARAHDGPHLVEVRDNRFDPGLIAVDPGDTVTWTLIEGVHTVTSDVIGQFSSGTMSEAGSTFEATMPVEDAWVYYHCSVHGGRGDPAGENPGVGMFGIIKVGSPPEPPPAIEVRAVPSLTYPTVMSALTGLRDGDRYRIELAPGEYAIERNGQRVLLNRANLQVGLPGVPLDTAFSVSIVGMGASPDDVVLTGGVLVGDISGFSFRNVSVEGAPDQGFLFDAGATKWRVEDVHIPEAARYGVLVRRDAGRGGIVGTSIAGASIAGIGIEGCSPCEIVVDDVTITDSLQGLAGQNAGGLAITRSTFANNGVGIALKTTVAEHAPARGAHIWNNTLTDNMNRSLSTPDPSARLDLPVGAGIWLAGTSYANVEGNTITGASFPIVVTGPAFANQVRDNVIGGAIEADLGWDGFGVNICFNDNRRPDGGDVTSMPPLLQTTHGCGLPASTPLPYPLVLARVLAWGLGQA